MGSNMKPGYMDTDPYSHFNDARPAADMSSQSLRDSIASRKETFERDTSEETGCPEIRSAMALIGALTPVDYEELCKRAKIILPEEH